MTQYFSPVIARWRGRGSWSEVYHCPAVWADLSAYIFSRHGLPFGDFEPLSPGINAVFRSGDYVIKYLPRGKAAPIPTIIIPSCSV